MPEFTDHIEHFLSRVTRRDADAALLDLAKKRALDAAVFDEHPPFIWRSEISNDQLDAYFTVMDPATTLVNYAADAAAGVAVLIGHDNRQAPTGYSLTGVLEQGDAPRVISDAYALTDAATTPIVNKLRAGVVRDVSVGFSTRGAKCICSICGRDMWRDWDCWHIPGFEYEVTEKGSTGSSGAKVMVLATGRIVDAHLSEYSLVYDGATPGAAVLQAQRAAEAGRLNIDQARLLEQRYRINLPGKRVVAPGHTVRNVSMEEKDILQLLERAGAPADLAVEQRGVWLATRIGELAQLAPLAEDGKTYRADLVNAGVAEAVRAFGAEDGEKKRDLLLRLDLETIKGMTASWREIGDSKLPGGRATTNDQPEREQPAPAKPVVIPGLYQG